MSECGGSVRVKVDTLDVANYSGDFAPYSDFYTALSYINQDPQPSVDVEQLYMGATARGCGAWFVAVTPPSQRWNVGHTYYTADGAGCPGSATAVMGPWYFVCEDGPYSARYNTTMVNLTMECISDSWSAEDDASGIGGLPSALTILAIVVVCAVMLWCCSCYWEKIKSSVCSHHRGDSAAQNIGTEKKNPGSANRHC